MANKPSFVQTQTNTKRDVAYYNRKKAIERLGSLSKNKKQNANLVELIDLLQQIDENAQLAKMNEYSMLNYGTKKAELRTYFSFDAPPLVKKRKAAKAFKKQAKKAIIKRED